MDPVITVPGLKAVADVIGSLVNWRGINEKEKQAQVKTALESLMSALRETRQYLAKVKRDPNTKDWRVENVLSQLWSKAGVDMLPINREVAERYVMKADYWSDPEGWDAKQKDGLIIELEEVFEQGRKALLDKNS